jgi:hypothetical protein
MIEKLFHNRQLNAEPCETGRERPAQIMHAPAWNRRATLHCDRSSSLTLAGPKPSKGERPVYDIMRSEPAMRGKDSRIAIVWLESGTRCSILFLLRAAGIVQIRFAKSTSAQRIPATSARRWPVKMNNTIGPNGQPMAPRPARRGATHHPIALDPGLFPPLAPSPFHTARPRLNLAPLPN